MPFKGMCGKKNKFEWCNIKGWVNHPPGERALLPGFQPQTLFLKEPGLYQLAFKSKLPSAVAFQDWIFSEVIPSLRKTGSYTLGTPIEKLRSIQRSDVTDVEEFKEELKEKLDLLKNPAAVEKGRCGGSKIQENRKKLIEEVRSLKFELVLANVREMVHTGVISKVLENS